MNLLDSPWLEVERRSGQRDRIAPIDLTDRPEDPVVRLTPPVALWEATQVAFLVGWLQTVRPPADHDTWFLAQETPPTREDLRAASAPWREAFEVFGETARPFQLAPAHDRHWVQADPGASGARTPVAERAGAAPLDTLMLHGPSHNTRAQGQSLYGASSAPAEACVACAMTALMTRATVASSLGGGFRSPPRGHGSLTAWVEVEGETLWSTIWRHVVPRDTLTAMTHTIGIPAEPTGVLPWVAGLTPEGVNAQAWPAERVFWAHSLAAYLPEPTAQGTCPYCGHAERPLLTHWMRFRHGPQHDGLWVHPLTPLRTMALKEGGEKLVPLEATRLTGWFRDWATLLVPGLSVRLPLLEALRGEAERLPHAGTLRLVGPRMNKGAYLSLAAVRAPFLHGPTTPTVAGCAALDALLQVADALGAGVETAVRTLHARSHDKDPRETPSAPRARATALAAMEGALRPAFAALLTSEAPAPLATDLVTAWEGIARRTLRAEIGAAVVRDPGRLVRATEAFTRACKRARKPLTLLETVHVA